VKRLIIAVVLIMASLFATIGGVSAASTSRVCSSVGPGCQFSSIQAAIDAAHNGSTINIAPGTYHENLTVGPTTASPLALVGEGGLAVTIDGGHAGSVLSVAAGHTVNLVGLVLTNGSAPSGGGIDNEGGVVNVTNSRITGNQATGDLFTNGTGFGGGIFNDAGTLKVVNSVVSGNHAQRGGGIVTGSENAEGTANVVNTLVAGNTASAAAGGVVNCGLLTMTNSPIRDNTAGQGGGLTNCGPISSGVFGTVKLVNSPVIGNHALGGPFGGNGGGISNAGKIVLVNSPVTNNTAPTGLVGGIYNPFDGIVTRINSPVFGNTPPQCLGVSGC
jgi:hypothetical protein